MGPEVETVLSKKINLWFWFDFFLSGLVGGGIPKSQFDWCQSCTSCISYQLLWFLVIAKKVHYCMTMTSLHSISMLWTGTYHVRQMLDCGLTTSDMFNNSRDGEYQCPLFEWGKRGLWEMCFSFQEALTWDRGCSPFSRREQQLPVVSRWFWEAQPSFIPLCSPPQPRRGLPVANSLVQLPRSISDCQRKSWPSCTTSEQPLSILDTTSPLHLMSHRSTVKTSVMTLWYDIVTLYVVAFVHIFLLVL